MGNRGKAVVETRHDRFGAECMDTVTFHDTLRAKRRFAGSRPNNAYFLNYIRYDAMKDSLDPYFGRNSGVILLPFLDFQQKRYAVQ